MGFELSDDDRKAMRASLLEGLKRAIRGDPGRTITGQPVAEFLAGPQPGDPFGAFQHRGGRASCDRWSRGNRGGILPNRDAWMRQLCSPYLGAQGPGDPTFLPPYTGGQCAGLNYRAVGRLKWDVFIGNTGGTSVNDEAFETEFRLLGPVGATRVEYSNNGPVGPRTFTIFVDTGSGETVLVQRVNPISTNSVSNARFEGGYEVAGGGDGGCGDPPSEFDPGAPNPSPDPNPGPVGGPTGYPWPDLDITINPDGSINVDFGDGGPPETIDPDPAADEPTGAPSVPTNPGSPGAPSVPGGGGSSGGDAPEGSELTGVLVRVLSAPAGANTFDNISETVYRGMGYVSMGYPGLLGVDTSAAVMESPQFFHAQQRGLTSWRVRANVGFSLESTPYYREI